MKKNRLFFTVFGLIVFLAAPRIAAADWVPWFIPPADNIISLHEPYQPVAADQHGLVSEYFKTPPGGVTGGVVVLWEGNDLPASLPNTLYDLLTLPCYKCKVSDIVVFIPLLSTAFVLADPLKDASLLAGYEELYKNRIVIAESETQPFTAYTPTGLGQPGWDVTVGDPYYSVEGMIGRDANGKLYSDPSTWTQYTFRIYSDPWGNEENDNDPLCNVPEPGTLLLLGGGLIAIGAFRRRFGK